MKARYIVALIMGLGAIITAVVPSLASGDTLANARDATAIYTDPSAALAGGYTLLTDAAGLACIDMPGQGAMGVHYVNGTLIQSGALDPARPQALVYEVQPSGRVQLVAVEYVVFQATWDASHNQAPTLFGQTFMLNAADNRFGLPAFYSLHAWIWKHNPSGTFAPFNPQVHCRMEVPGATSSDSQAAVDATGMDGGMSDMAGTQPIEMVP
jgi:hypothetical protein